MSSALSIHPGKIKWTLHPDHEQLRAYLETGEWQAQCKEIKTTDRRTVYYVKQNPGLNVDPAENECSKPALFVKHDHPPGLRDKIKSLWRCKSKVEYSIGDQLGLAHVNAAPVVAWGRQGQHSWLVTLAIEQVKPLDEVWRTHKENSASRSRFMQGLQQLFGQMQNAGVLHRDLHARNVLVNSIEDSNDTDVPAAMRMHLVDYYEASVQPGRPANALKSAAWLLTELLPELTLDEVGQLRDALAIEKWAGKADADLVWRDAIDQECRRTIHRNRHRKGKIVKASGICIEHRVSEGNWLIQLPALPCQTSEIRGDVVDSGMHDDVQQVMATALHDVVHSSNEFTAIAGNRYSIVRYAKPETEAAAKQLRQRWLNAFFLFAPFVKTANHVAWFKGDDGSGAFVVEDVGQLTLAQRIDQICQGDGTSKTDNVDVLHQLTELVQDAARCLARLHRVGVFMPARFDNFVHCTCAVNSQYAVAIVDPSVAAFPGNVSIQNGMKALAGLSQSLLDSIEAIARQDLCKAMREAYETEIKFQSRGGFK
jgi:hypothetical protein